MPMEEAKVHMLMAGPDLIDARP